MLERENMNCIYCDGDREGFVRFLPKVNKGFNAYISKERMGTVRLIVSGANKKQGVFDIEFCPMCGKKLHN